MEATELTMGIRKHQELRWLDELVGWLVGLDRNVCKSIKQDYVIGVGVELGGLRTIR